MEIELSFSYPSSQISRFPFPGLSVFVTPSLWQCGFSEVVYTVQGIGEGESKVEGLTDWQTGCSGRFSPDV